MDAAAQVHAAFVALRRADVAGGSEVALSAWCPTMDLCAAVTSDGQLAVHRMNWQRLWALAPDAPVTALAWRPDGKLLATGHKDGSLSVWDVETGRPVARHARAHFAPVTALDWSVTPLSARVDHDDDRWAMAATTCAGQQRSNDGDVGGGAVATTATAAAAAAVSSATAAEYEDRQARLFPADGVVMLSGSGAGAAAAAGTTTTKEDPYAELFRGAPRPPPPSAGTGNGGGGRGGGAGGDPQHANGDSFADPALATWDIEVAGGGKGSAAASGAATAAAAPSSSSSPPLDLLCAADRRGCLSCWVGAGRVQVGDVAGLAAAVPAEAEAQEEDEDVDDDRDAATPAPAPPPPPTLVALSTALDQSACVSVAWHSSAPPPPEAAADARVGRRRRGGGGGGGVLATPMLARPLRAARREVRHWARLQWRLQTLLASASGALRAAEKEWGSATSTLRKRFLDELAENLVAHGDGGGGGEQQQQQQQQEEQQEEHDPRAELLLLLATGSAGAGLHAWLTGSLGEAGVQRAARAVDAALERAHSLLLHACLPALERAVFCLGELRGLAAACCPAGGAAAAAASSAFASATAGGGLGRGAILGLRPEAIEPLEAAAVRAVVRAEQVRLAVGDLAASYRALFTWLLRTARQLETASSAAGAADAAADINRPPPEPPTGPDAALADVLLPILEDGGPLQADPLGPELGQRDAPLDDGQQRAAARWLHHGGGGGGSSSGGGGGLAPDEVVSRVLRILYSPERAQQQHQEGGFAGVVGSAEAPLSLAGQVSALAEACEEALAAPQASISAALAVGRPVRLAPALCFGGLGGAPPRVAVAPEGDGDDDDNDGADDDGDDDDEAAAQPPGSNNDDDGQGGVVVCVVVPAAGLEALSALRAQEDGSEAEATPADGILVVRARAVAAAGGGGGSGGLAEQDAAPPLELRLSAVLVRADPESRVVDAVPYKGGQLAVLSTPARGRGGAGGGGGGGAGAAAEAAAPPPPPNPVLALLDLSSAPFTPFATAAAAAAAAAAAGAATAASPSSSALELCLARGAVVSAAELAAEGLVRAARMGGFAAAVAPLAVSRARGLALVLSDMQRLAVLDVEADEEGVLEGEEEEA